MIVADTHVLIWAVQDDGRLGPAARGMVEAAAQADGLTVAAITPWEIAMLAQKGRLALGRDVGAWIEQLVAESTGKNGKGLIPVDGETVGPPAVYGDDRLFVHLGLAGRPDPEAGRLAVLEAAGHPVVRLTLADPYALGGEFFRWEMATAVAGAVLGVNPFDQPDVEASKIATRALTDAYERTGRLPDEAPILDDRGIALFAADLPPRFDPPPSEQQRLDLVHRDILSSHVTAAEQPDVVTQAIRATVRAARSNGRTPVTISPSRCAAGRTHG